MPSSDDEVEIVGFTVAGPSRKPPSGLRPTRSIRSARRKVPFVPPQDVIEIIDSDAEDGGEGSGARDAERYGEEGPLQEPGSHGQVDKAPLFLAEEENDSEEELYAMLDEVGDAPPPPHQPDDDPRPEREPLPFPLDEALVHPPLNLEPPDIPLPDSDVDEPPLANRDDRIARLSVGIGAIVPDVEPTYLRSLITRQLAANCLGDDEIAGFNMSDEHILETVVNYLFENPDYPKEVPQADAAHDDALDAAHDDIHDAHHPGPPLSKSPTPLSVGGKPPEAKTGAPSSSRSAEEPQVKAPEPLDVPSSSDKGKGRAIPDAPHAKLEADPVSHLVAQILEIVPDVEPDHVRKLVQAQLDVTMDFAEGEDGTAGSGPTLYQHVSGAVLHNLFENPDYPKASKKRKRSEDDNEESPMKAAKLDEIDYADKNRARPRGRYYDEVALVQLVKDFPSINASAMQTCYVEHNRLYAPTYLALREQQGGAANMPVVPSDDAKEGGTKRSSSSKKSKGKGVQRSDPDFEKERAWLIRKLQDDALEQGVEAEAEADSEGFECGCCFSEYPFSKMTQCPDAHLFCTTCVVSYASTLLSEHNHQIACMDQSGCKLLFSPIELRRFLPAKLLELYERISQRKELEAAGLEGLEECPFCEYQVVIENEQEKLFRCERPDCGAVTCRKCKKMDHLPKSCEENEEDKKLDARHTIEEAMTRALMRNCPKCNKAFIKESGCNKMVCPNCRTLSCYICRKIIKGYDHFSNPPPYNGPLNSNKCQLWDQVEKRHADEVMAAAKKAQEEYRMAHPEVEDADLNVDLPKPVAGASNANPHGLHHLPPMHALPQIPVAQLHHRLQQIRAIHPPPPIPAFQFAPYAVPQPIPAPVLRPPPAHPVPHMNIHPHEALFGGPQPPPNALPGRRRTRAQAHAAAAPAPPAPPVAPVLNAAQRQQEMMARAREAHRARRAERAEQHAARIQEQAARVEQRAAQHAARMEQHVARVVQHAGRARVEVEVVVQTGRR